MKIIDIRGDEYENPTKIVVSSDIGPTTVKCPGAIYASRPLSAMIRSAEFTRSLRINSKLGKSLFQISNII